MASKRVGLTDRDELRADVAVMRELGVARWVRGESDIFLGPPPAPPETKLTPEERFERDQRELQKRHETLFASTSVRPVLHPQERQKRASVLESVVPAVIRNGTTKPA